MNKKIYAIVGVFALAFCCLAFMPSEESDAGSETQSVNAGYILTGTTQTVTSQSTNGGYWNDNVKSITVTSTQNCSTGTPQATRSGEAYNWSWSVSCPVTPTNSGTFSFTIVLVTNGGFLTGDDTFTFNFTGGTKGTITLHRNDNVTAYRGTTAITFSSSTYVLTGNYYQSVQLGVQPKTGYTNATLSVYDSNGTLVDTGDSSSLTECYYDDNYDVYYSATAAQTYTVSIVAQHGSATASSGGNSVTSTGSSRSLTVLSGATVTFTKGSADSGYEFSHWRYNIGYTSYTSYSSTLTLTANNNISVTCVYTAIAPTPFTLTFTTFDPEYGTVSSSTYTVTSGSAMIKDAADTLERYLVIYDGNKPTVYITPVPVADTVQWHYYPTGWTYGNNVPVPSESMITITSATTFTAQFSRELRNYDVTIQPNNQDYGSVDIGSVTVPYGTSITSSDNTVTIGDTVVTATPAPQTANYRYSFVNWTNGTGTVEGDVTITANFNRSDQPLVTFVADPVYGSFQPVSSINVPIGSTIYVNGSTITINNVTVSAVPNASDGDYSYSFDSWDVTNGDIIYGDTTITATFTRTAIQHITHWSNNMVNGAVTFVFDWPATETETHNMSMALWSGTVNSDYTTSWTDTGYVLNISASFPNTNFAFDLQLNGTSVKTDTVTVGKWSTYELIIDATNGQVIMTPTATFSDFMTYTTLDSQRTVVFDFSDIKKNTAIQVIDHEDTGTGGHVRFSVTNTSVFLNTYGVVMNNPTINLYNHFPQYDKLRANFYGFALYGQSMTVNNTTYTVQNGAVTVSYATLGDGTKVLPSLAPDKPVETRTLALNNVSITWDGSHCYLTFESDRFTIDLGAYQQGNELVSFAGLWYFTSVLYEPSTTTAKELGEWKMLPDLSWNQMLIIFLGVIVLAGAALYIRLNGSFLDLLLIGGAAVTAFILIW